MKCNVTRQSATWLQQADLISGYSRPILFRVTAGRSYSDLISGYSRPILFPHSAKRVLDCRQNHHGCRQNKLRLLWNALLTTPYVSKHYKYMFLVARDLYEMLVFYRGKHTTRRSTVGIWSEVRVYRTPVHEYTVLACTWASFQTTGAWCVDAGARSWAGAKNFRWLEPEPEIWVPVPQSLARDPANHLEFV